MRKEFTQDEKAIYFWEEGVFSHWYFCDFVIEGVTYNCVEQYLMAEKAYLFGDMETYALIMDAKDPLDHKYYGRNVKNFREWEWDLEKEKIAYHGNLAKFSQNKELKDLLLKTKEKHLVEGSPFDVIWGVGIHFEDALIKNPRNWTGKNLLGKILMQVRSDLK